MVKIKGKIKQDLLQKAKEEGFESIDDFVKANLHYLPENQQRLFHSIAGIRSKTEYKGKDIGKLYHKSDCSYGKG